MRIVLTGAAGFLGWHTRLRLHAQGDHDVVPLTRANWKFLGTEISDADAVIHIAGVNRADDDAEVFNGNVALAEALAEAMEARPSLHVVYANSTQSGNGTPYGSGKEHALRVLMKAARRNGGTVVDVRLPNIFGEHGRPHYNSFVATFVEACVRGEIPRVQDNVVTLLHAQEAAQILIDALTGTAMHVEPNPTSRSVLEVWNMLTEFHNTYTAGDIPDLSSTFRVDLFNTYRASLFPQNYPIRLTPHADERGMFVETVRSRGGEGQSSISTTAPGVTRGEHFHLRKIERFAVIEGQAIISLRRMFTREIINFSMAGSAPAAIDMPTGWVHNITNTGTGTLITQFWSHELFHPQAADTYPEPVQMTAPKGELA